jgi:two-component system OmpR family sensor kinase
VVRVKDHGIGIPEKDRAQLFERYYRGSNVSGIVGTGVGLYLVKMMIERHGGEISVASREGEGSEFIVRLPRKRAAQPVTSSGWGAPSEAPEDAVPLAPHASA